MVFHNINFYSTTLISALTHPGISTGSSFRPVHSRVRQSARQGEHSNHGRLVDPWPIGSTSHLWGAFAGIGCRFGCSRPLSRGFIQEPLQLMHARRGQAFQGVTPSFHLSNYQLSTQHSCVSASFLPLANVSHSSRIRHRPCRPLWCWQ